MSTRPPQAPLESEAYRSVDATEHGVYRSIDAVVAGSSQGGHRGQGSRGNIMPTWLPREAPKPERYRSLDAIVEESYKGGHGGQGPS